MNVFVAIPALTYAVTCETMRSVLMEQAAAHSLGIGFQVAFCGGNSLLPHVRNQLVRDFLRSDADRLVFLDSDVAWDEPGPLLKVATAPADFVGGGYRYKSDNEGYPVAWVSPGEPLWSNAHGLIEVSMLPGGFMSLSRGVFGRLREAHPSRGYSFFGQDFHAFFHCPPGDGEDGAFCRDWRAAGGQIWLDPALTLSHVDTAGRKYTGNIGQWLKARPPLELAA